MLGRRSLATLYDHLMQLCTPTKVSITQPYKQSKGLRGCIPAYVSRVLWLLQPYHSVQHPNHVQAVSHDRVHKRTTFPLTQRLVELARMLQITRRFLESQHTL